MPSNPHTPTARETCGTAWVDVATALGGKCTLDWPHDGGHVDDTTGRRSPTLTMVPDDSYTVTVRGFGLDQDARNALFDRVADAAHAHDEEVFCSGDPDNQGQPVTLRDLLRAAHKAGIVLCRNRQQDTPGDTGYRQWHVFGPRRVFLECEDGRWYLSLKDDTGEEINLARVTLGRVVEAVALIGWGVFDA